MSTTLALQPDGPLPTTGCWDDDASGRVDLIGITCSSVSTSASAKV